jgi:uncharacterized membrane protein
VNFKRMLVFGFITGMLIWGMSELFNWVLADLIGAGEVSRIAPGIAGLVLGMTQAALVQMMRKKRKEMLGGQQ